MSREERVCGLLALLLVKTRRPWQAQIWFTRFGLGEGWERRAAAAVANGRRGRRKTGGEGGGGRWKKKDGNTVNHSV